MGGFLFNRGFLFNKGSGGESPSNAEAFAESPTPSVNAAPNGGKVATFLDMAFAVEAAGNTTESLRRLFKSAVQIMGADFGLLFGWEESQLEWSLIAQFGIPGGFRRGTPVLQRFQSLAGIVKIHGSCIFSSNLSKDPRFSEQLIRRLQIETYAGTVLEIDRKTVGTLSLAFKAPDALTVEDQATFIAISKILGLLLSRLSDRTRVKPPKGVTDAISADPKMIGISQGLADTLLSNLHAMASEQMLCKKAIDQVVSIIGADGGYIAKFDEQRQRFFAVAHQGLSTPSLERFERQGIRPDGSVLGKIQKGEPLTLIGDGNSPLDPLFVGGEGWRTYVGTTLPVAKERWIIALFSATMMTEAAVMLTESAVWIGTAIEIAANHQLAATQIAALNQRQRINNEMASLPSLEPLLCMLVQTFVKVADVSHCSIFLLDPYRKVLYGAAALNTQIDAIRKMEFRPWEQTLVPLAAARRQAIVSENAPEDPRVGKTWKEAFKSQSLLAVPLVMPHRVVGVLVLDETRCFKQFLQEDIEGIVTLAETAVVAIDRALCNKLTLERTQRLRLLATGLNRREQTLRGRTKTVYNDISRDLSNLPAPPPTEPAHLESVPPSPPDPSNPSMGNSSGEAPQDKPALVDLQPKIESTKIESIEGHLARIRKKMETHMTELQTALPPTAELVSRLQSYLDAYRKQARLQVQFTPKNIPKRLPGGLDALLYQIAHEALRNVAQHATARSIVITLQKQAGPGRVNLSITDDGKGFAMHQSSIWPIDIHAGTGLLWIREAVEGVGGTFWLDSTPLRGTCLSVTVPLQMASN